MAQWVKELVVLLLWLWLRLWYKFYPWPRNVHMPWPRPRKPTKQTRTQASLLAVQGVTQQPHHLLCGTGRDCVSRPFSFHFFLCGFFCAPPSLSLLASVSLCEGSLSLPFRLKATSHICLPPRPGL